MATELDPYGVESRALLAAVDFNNARVLEVGCGDGRLAFRYADAAKVLVGIEPGINTLAEARSGCPSELQKRVRFVQATALALPFPNETFDVAVLAWSL